MEGTIAPHLSQSAQKSRRKKIYDWLIDQKAFSGIIGSVLFPLILVPFFVWMTRYVNDNLNQTDEEVCINLPPALDDYKFWLRFVREGTGAAQGPLFNADYEFKPLNGSRTRCVNFPHRKHYGAQFKPYMVKNAGVTYDQAKDLLSQAGYDKNYITPDCWEPSNIWFLLPPSSGYGVIQDVGNPLPMVAFATPGGDRCIPGQNPGSVNPPSSSIILNNFSPK